MHRMPTAAVLAVVVATTATGCMTVNTRPAPAGPPRPVRPAPSAEPPGPQTPPRDTRSSVASPPPADRAHKDPHHKRADGNGGRRTSQVPAQGERGGGAAGPRPAPAGRQGADADDRRTDRPAGQDRAKTPRVPRIGGMPAVPSGTDICALGRAYGHWQRDDAAQQVCGASYGN